MITSINDNFSQNSSINASLAIKCQIKQEMYAYILTIDCADRVAKSHPGSEDANTCMYVCVDDVCERTDLIELSVGAENEGEDVKHFDPYHTAGLIPFRDTVEYKRWTAKIQTQHGLNKTEIKVMTNKV